MSKIFSILLIACCCNPLLAQSTESLYASSRQITFYQPLKYSYSYFSQAESNKFIAEMQSVHPLEKTGKILTYIGIPVTIIGIIMVSNADSLYYQCTNGTCNGDPLGGFGIAVLATGIGLTGTGIVLWSIGAKKTKANKKL